MPTNVTKKRSELVGGKGLVAQSDAGLFVVFEDPTKGIHQLNEDDPAGKYINAIPLEQPAYIQLSNDKSQIWTMKPWEGNFFVRFERFAAKKDQLPTIRHRKEKWLNGPNGQWPLPAADVFVAIFRIVGVTPWAKVDVTKEYEYVWYPQAGTNLADIEGRTTPVTEVEDLLKIMGHFDFLTEAFRYSDKLLVEIEKRLQETNAIGYLNVHNGFAKALTSADGINTEAPEFA